MKLAPQSIPYRALQKVSGFVVVLLFLANSNDWGLAAAVGLSGGLLLAAFGYEVAYYRRFEYELTPDTLDISSGVISRREREIPYQRIQNVDVSQSVIQRALGVAAVDLETAGGSSTEGSIRFVTPDEATRLQRELQRRKSDASGAGGDRSTGTSAAGTDATGTATDRDPTGPTEEELFAISPGELALVGALSFDGRLIGLLAFLGSGSFPVLSSLVPEASAAALTATAVVAVGGLFLVSWAVGAGLAFSNYYGFTLSRAGDELRYERGLFRRYSGSIPTEKVQTLTVSDNPAKRALGYASLSIETAGYAPGQGGDQGSQAAVPIATTDRVYRLAHEVESFGTPTFERPPKRIRWRYLFRYALVVGLLVAVAFAVDWYVAVDLPWYGPLALLLAVPPAAHLKWKHRGYWIGEDHLLTRNGFWSRTVTVVPYYRIQNVIDSRTVFQRRWGVATIVADTAGSSSLAGSGAAAVDFEVDEAVALRETLRERLHDAVAERRSRRSAFEWFEGDAAAVDADVADRDEVADRGDVADRDDLTGSTDTTTADTANDTTAADTANDTTAADTANDTTAADTANDTTTADTANDTTTADEPDAPPDGVVRPDFSVGERDYSEPAERVDTGEYAVDRFPSDADVAHRPDEGSGANGDSVDASDDDDTDASDDEASLDDDAEPSEKDASADDDDDDGDVESTDDDPTDAEP